jgi:flagellar hook-length control protein FliK
MAVASNPLLQIGSPTGNVGKASTTALGSLGKGTDAAKDGGSSFAQVYAQEHKAVPHKAVTSAAARTANHLGSTDKKPAVSTAVKDDKPAVANDSKPSVSKNDKPDKASKAAKPDNTKAADDRDKVQAQDAADDAKVVSDNTVDDPAAAEDSTADLALSATPALADPTAAAQPAAPVALDPALLPQPLVDPATLQTAVQAQAPTGGEDFDPTADALADLPMVRMALEQSAKDQGTTSVHAQAEGVTAQALTDPAAGASFSESLGAMVEQQRITDTAGSDDSDGLGGIGELKGGQASDGAGARVDDINNRLSQLNQAVSGKAPAAATPLSQPLNMQQNGWSEGVVNRVMYLSSQNLKSADIQLHPLELGRLDIRVDVTPDQQTQITFHSAHLGVRDALEGQQNRLRDMLAEQGMTQVNVNVSDQSQQSRQQQQEAQASQNSGSQQGRGGSVADDTQEQAVAQAAATQTVIGSSMVDYYA